MTSLLSAIASICALSLLVGNVSCCSRVPQAPHGRKGRGDNGYRIIIGDEPSGYEPGRIYNCKDKNFFLEISDLSLTYEKCPIDSVSLGISHTRKYSAIHTFHIKRTNCVYIVTRYGRISNGKSEESWTISIVQRCVE